MTSTIDTSLLKKAQPLSENANELENFLKQLSQLADDNAINRVISLYEKTIISLEQKIWKNKPGRKEIKQYQQSFSVLEKLHQLKTADARYNFKIVIPVADRPQHLKNCLTSLLSLCKSYNYGGYKNNKFNKISVLIADDSSDYKNIKQHKNYCTEFSDKGINTEYFGLKEQLALVNDTTANNADLSNIISSIEGHANHANFSHKGASIMRNITYLKINQTLSQNEKKNTLIYFIDSDQEFCINTLNAPENSDKNLFAINYFHYLNEIFKSQDVSILTGKVVGDPPVSPSVMAGNFQQDIKNFLNTIENLNPNRTCQFHQHETGSKGAEYHDMAGLFGFSEQQKTFNYHCTLHDAHTNADCFHDFSEKLSHFFYGGHPTRKTFFQYEDGFLATIPARTVYTGNYVIKPKNLEHFIPFATLKLRMAGPVLGRLLNAQLKNKFVSANLPMLHNRTLDSTGQAEFRLGVENKNNTIDLSNEFIRQFYGDVMLFSIKKITEQNLTCNTKNHEKIQSIINVTYADIKENYIEKHNVILQLKTQLKKQLDKKDNWWNIDKNSPEKTSHKKINHTKINFHNFLKNIETNFSEENFAFQEISSSDNAEKHLTSILQAILHYQDDVKNWRKAFTSESKRQNSHVYQ
ncbi:hypothetical protein MNBD_GAMMA06-1037 [hydrothermal vent metagenome]|uniref:Uncharacterized protein n=1 Tax=hydrothermal vent metagenome TaxID=652676 RepID=A0A3B0WHD8_9ZZZZ